MSYVKFGTFLDMIDREIRQKKQDNVVAVKDYARLVKQVDVAHWVNQSLGYLSSVNESFWRHTQEYTPEISTSRLVLPFFWKRLETIVIKGIPHKVGVFTDMRYDIYHEKGNVVARRHGEFEAGVPITFVGVFRPNMLPTTGEESDLQAPIDIDPDWINLLKLSVLIKYSGRENMQTSMWYGQYKEELEAFRKASPTIQVTHTWRNKIRWGEQF